VNFEDFSFEEVGAVEKTSPLITISIDGEAVSIHRAPNGRLWILHSKKRHSKKRGGAGTFPVMDFVGAHPVREFVEMQPVRSRRVLGGPAPHLASSVKVTSGLTTLATGPCIEGSWLLEVPLKQHYQVDFHDDGGRWLATRTLHLPPDPPKVHQLLAWFERKISRPQRRFGRYGRR
jgi:hypothetical protein